MGRPQFSRRSESAEFRASAEGSFRFKDYSFGTAPDDTDTVDLITKSDEPDAIKNSNEVVTGIYMCETVVDPQKVCMQFLCKDGDGNDIWEVRNRAESLDFSPPLRLPPDGTLKVFCNNTASTTNNVEFNVVVMEVDT